MLGSTVLLIAAIGFGQSETPKATEQSIVIENVTVISPERPTPLRNAAVVIRDGRIAEVSTKAAENLKAKRIDGRGRFLIPGLIDSHVHVGHSAALDDDAIDAHPELWAAYRMQVPRAYLAFGFTTVVDLDTKPSDKAWFEGAPLQPRFYSCGRGITVAGGDTAFEVPAAGTPDFPNIVYEPKEAEHWPKALEAADYTPERAVARAADGGGNCVKAFVESGFEIFHWPYLHTETLERIHAAAKARKMPLLVHATSIESWREALAANAEIIAHGLWVWPGDFADAAPPADAAKVIAAAARAGTHVQPTLQVVTGERAFADASVAAGLLNDPRLAYALPASVVRQLRSPEGEKARLALLEQYRKVLAGPGFEKALNAQIERTHLVFKVMLQDHVPLILGSDTPAGEGFGNPPGLNGRLEMQDWADAGAPLELILRAGTLENAKALGLANELGSIEPGKCADLVLLRENPLEKITAYDSIETIFLNGTAIAREALRPAN